MLRNSAHGSQEIAEICLLWSIHLNDDGLQYNHRRVKVVGTERHIKTDAHCLAWRVAARAAPKATVQEPPYWLDSGTLAKKSWGSLFPFLLA